MDVDSHIQLPRFILNYFKRPNGQVCYLSLNDFRLHSCGPKKLGTQKGYFSKEMEQYLSRQIEHPSSKLVAEVTAFVEQEKESITLPADVENVCKRYVSAAAYRSEKAYSNFMEGSLTAGLFDAQTNHDDLVLFSTQHNGGIFLGLEKARMMVLVNRTERLFVVPRNCFYIISSNSMPCIIAPTSPKCAFGIVPESFPVEDGFHLWFVDDPDDVWHMNKQALCMEFAFNHEFVVSTDKSELEQLKSYAEANIAMLESLRTASSE